MLDDMCGNICANNSYCFVVFMATTMTCTEMATFKSFYCMLSASSLTTGVPIYSLPLTFVDTFSAKHYFL